MKLNCLNCGHGVGLKDAYDDFEGRVRCQVCGAILEIKTAQGRVKKIKYDSLLFQPGARSRETQGIAGS